MPILPKITSLPIFAIFKEEESQEVDFLRADKHERFLKIDSMIFEGDVQASPKFPK